MVNCARQRASARPKAVGMERSRFLPNLVWIFIRWRAVLCGYGIPRRARPVGIIRCRVSRSVSHPQNKPEEFMIMRMLAKTLIGILGLAIGASALADDNGALTDNLAAGSASDNRGQILCTAAINSDGTKAGGSTVSSSTYLGAGTYEVLFKGPCAGNITAVKGWARIVQVDTLTAGTHLPTFCTTADRAGATNGVFVKCTDGAGTATDTSFSLYILR